MFEIILTTVWGPRESSRGTSSTHARAADHAMTDDFKHRNVLDKTEVWRTEPSHICNDM